MSDSHADMRPLLQQERVDLLSQIDELTVGGEVDLDFDDDFADRAQVASEKNENRTLAGTLQSQLAMVEHALARLDDGTYGTCETCGRAIGADRLDVIPAASQCIEHAGAPPAANAGN